MDPVAEVKRDLFLGMYWLLGFLPGLWFLDGSLLIMTVCISMLRYRDIDIYIDQENFYKLQSELLQRNYALKRNVRSMNFEALIGDVEGDIHLPFLSNLAVPCLDVFNQRLYSLIERFRAAIPKVLLLLKAQVAQQRWHAEKGVKDRVDIISLLKFADIKRDLLKQMLRKYDRQHMLRDVIKRATSESRIEYKFLRLTYEKDGVKLKNPLGACRVMLSFSRVS